MARENDFNLDPISKEPGAHPVGTGVGAAVGGAAAGAVAGTFAGPVGTMIGAVAGAVAGGLGGKAAAESINPTAEAAYWESSYTREPYYEAGRSFDDYGPAYRLGLSGYHEYGGHYDAGESRLASQWDAKRERSTLSWPQASAASRAAWERVGSVAGADLASNDDVIDTLNDLLECSRDGEYGFKACAERTDAQDIKTLLLQRSAECGAAAVELQTAIIQLGGDVDDGGSVAGALHRGWVSVKGALSGHSDLAMLEECERGEDAAVAQYRKALKQNLPYSVKTLVEKQARGAQHNHDQVKALRNALRGDDNT